MKKISNEKIKQIIDLYSKGIGSPTIAKKLFISQMTVLNYLKIYNINRRTLAEANRKLQLNEKFFDKINTEKSAYYLGLLYADGCNHEPYYISLELQEGDIDIILKLRDILYPDIKPKLSKRKFDKGQDSVKLVISSKYISNELSQKGIMKKKSLILKFPKFIDKNLLYHFVRGYFDGDGSIYLTHNKHCLSFLGTHDFLMELQNILCNSLGIKRTKIIIANKKSSILKMAISNLRDIEKIIKYMYKNSNIFLNRKQDKCYELLDMIKSGKKKYQCHTSVYPGVCFDKSRNKWMAYSFSGKSLGRFNTEKEAFKIRRENCA